MSTTPAGHRAASPVRSLRLNALPASHRGFRWPDRRSRTDRKSAFPEALRSARYAVNSNFACDVVHAKTPIPALETGSIIAGPRRSVQLRVVPKAVAPYKTAAIRGLAITSHPGSAIALSCFAAAPAELSGLRGEVHGKPLSDAMLHGMSTLGRPNCTKRITALHPTPTVAHVPLVTPAGKAFRITS